MRLAAILSVSLFTATAHAQPITSAGQPAQLDIRAAGDHSIRVTLKPQSYVADFPETPALADHAYPSSAIRLREIKAPVRRKVGELTVDVRANPLAVSVRSASGRLVQEIRFRARRHGVLRARRASGARDGRGRSASGEGHAVARSACAVRQARCARYDGAALAERHVRIAQPVADAAGHGRLGAVRRRAVGARGPAPRRSRRVPAVEADGRRERAADREQSAAESRQGTASDRSDRAGARRPLRLRCGRSVERPEGLRAHHRTGRDAAEVGARLHAVAPHARHRRADDRDHRHVPLEADSDRCGHLPRHRLLSARLEYETAVVRLPSRGVHARSEGRARRDAREAREGGRSHGPVGSRQAAHAARHDPAAARRDARRIAHSELLAAARAARPVGHRRVLAGRRRLVQPLRADQASPAVLPGSFVDDPERASLEPSAQRSSGHRAVGRLGLVRGHGNLLEDARSADRRGHQLFAEHRACTGARTSAASIRTTSSRASCTRGGTSSPRSADRFDRTDAHGSRGSRGAGA